jgi:transposase
VPYQLVGKRLDLRATEATIELFLGGRRITSHARSYVKYKHTTRPEHMPKSHRAHAEWTPSRIIDWARSVGPSTAALAEELMQRRPHPEQGFRSCLGLLRLRKKYPQERIERACARALKYRACTYKSVAAILANNLDGKDLVEESQRSLPLHRNVRGPGYYH